MAYTKLKQGGSVFGDMMANGFGIVTVMNANVYEALSDSDLKAKTAYEILEGAKEPLCTIDTLKIANVTMEGPTKTITGGQYTNPLIKFGKTARLEMQDALGRADAIEALCGGVKEHKGKDAEGDLMGLHFGQDFCSEKMIIGDSFFIDKETAQQVPVKVIFYKFLPDSIFNLTQDAEGDATVFDMNGDLLIAEIKVGDSEGNPINHGVFYSIVDATVKPETEGQ